MNKNKINNLFISLLMISFIEILFINIFNLRYPMTWYFILTKSSIFMIILANIFMGYFKIKEIIEDKRLKNILDLIGYILSLTAFILIILFVKDTNHIIKIAILQGLIYLLFTYILDSIDTIIYAIWTRKQILISIISILIALIIIYIFFRHDYINILIMIALLSIYISKYFIQGVNKKGIRYINDFSFTYVEYDKKNILNVEIREFSKKNVRLGFVDRYKNEIISQWYRKKDLEKVVRLMDSNKE